MAPTAVVAATKAVTKSLSNDCFMLIDCCLLGYSVSFHLVLNTNSSFLKKTKKQQEITLAVWFLLLFVVVTTSGPCSESKRIGNYFPWCSSDTVNFLRPWARREANTRRPFLVAILSRKPCLFTLLLLCGWNVLFIVFYNFYLLLFSLRAAKLLISFELTKN